MDVLHTDISNNELVRHTKFIVDGLFFILILVIMNWSDIQNSLWMDGLYTDISDNEK